VSEATPVGSIVLTLRATDLDANLGGNITYTLVSPSNDFAIDSLTGDLTLTHVLDYDMMDVGDRTKVLVINAQDAGPGTKKSASTTVLVTVQDSDDNGPAFVYQGCFESSDVCAWPKYTTSLTLKKDQAISVSPVPNKVNGFVNIEAHDLDLGIGSRIKFSIASTIPPGHEDEFLVQTVTLPNNRYKANIISRQDKVVNEGFEIFLKAQEDGTAQEKEEVAMIYFTDPTSSGNPGTGAQQGSQVLNNGNNNNDNDNEYSERELALAITTGILATFVFCLTVTVACLLWRRGAGGSKSTAF
jgi:hypothetical protein